MHFLALPFLWGAAAPSFAARHARKSPSADVAVSTKTHVTSTVERTTTPARWNVITKGPFIPDTAEASPVGTWVLNPTIYLQSTPDGQYSAVNIEEFSTGLGSGGLEFDTALPLIPNNSPNYFEADQYWFKWQVSRDDNTYRFFSRPAVSIEPYFLVPGQSQNETTQEGIFIPLHKRFKPFELYAQAGMLLPNSFQRQGQINEIWGNLYSYSAALEDVMSDKHGAGWILEAYGETQDKNSLFGGVNQPAWSFISASPDLEVTWPNRQSFEVGWSVGMFFPLMANGTPWSRLAIASVTLYFNGIYGNRLEH